MRLWSISMTYLDNVGLSRCFNEGKLGLRVLLQGEYKIIDSYIGKSITGKSLYGKQTIKTPYYHHSQLLRFKATKYPEQYLSNYLWGVYEELKEREMARQGKFDTSILLPYKILPKLTVTDKQLIYEFEHLQNKLWQRNKKQFDINMYQIGNSLNNIKSHPLFIIVKGNIESFERIKK